MSQFLRAPIFLDLRDRLWLRFGYVFKVTCGVWNWNPRACDMKSGWISQGGLLGRETEHERLRAASSLNRSMATGEHMLSNPGLSLRAEASPGCRDSKLPKLYKILFF